MRSTLSSYRQYGLKKFLLLKKLKILYHALMLLMILMMKKLLEILTKNICKKTNQKTKKTINYM